ncbi:hypothetical protein [Nostoc piscinale]|uniref:hypothetical protein n=1 Tax=Nostoc piscinale TaxID=224012 RepID=UPI000AA8C577|nr:hypothetical protein [Nostoc piscinale]
MSDVAVPYRSLDWANADLYDGISARPKIFSSPRHPFTTQAKTRGFNTCLHHWREKI